MAVSITQNPTNTPLPAGQHLPFTLYDATTPDRYIVYVYEHTSTSGDGDLIATLYLPPNGNGRAIFDLSDIAEGRVSAPSRRGSVGATEPVHGSTQAIITGNTPALLKYTIKAAQFNSGTASAVEATAVVYLLGGVQQIADGLLPSFAAYYPTGNTQKAFLTDRVPDASNEIHLTMAQADEMTAWFLKTNNLNATEITAKATYFNLKDGTLQGINTQAVSDSTTLNNLYMGFQIGPEYFKANVTTGVWNDDWDELRFFISDSGSTAQTAIYVIKRDCRPVKHDPVQIGWANSVGGWDYLRFDGRAPKQVQKQAKEYRQTAGVYDGTTFSMDATARQATPYQTTATNTYTLTNNSFTQSEVDLLQYAFRSKDVWYRVGTGGWLPCNIRTNSYVVQPARSRVYQVSMQIEQAQDIRC